MLDLKELRRVASEATQGDYGGWFESCRETVDVVVDCLDGSTEGILIAKVPVNEDRKHIATFNPQTALVLLDLLDKAVSMAKDFVECSEPMSDLEYKVATKMIAREFLALVKQVTK